MRAAWIGGWLLLGAAFIAACGGSAVLQTQEEPGLADLVAVQCPDGEPQREGRVPLMFDVLSVAPDAEGARLVINLGRDQRLSGCREASLTGCPDGVLQGLVRAIGQSRTEIVIPATPEAVAKCRSSGVVFQ